MVRFMNKLSRAQRAHIISLLVEGMSLRAVTRTTGASINTVTKLLVDAGRACSDYQDKALRDLSCKRLQIDEIWEFCYAKAKNVATAKRAPKEAGDIWTFVAIDGHEASPVLVRRRAGCALRPGIPARSSGPSSEPGAAHHGWPQSLSGRG